jgi:peptidoglycan/LPS O-acetylase OafA/YrhL
MPPTRREPRHFDYIDAVRGFAFLGVLFTHSASACGHFPCTNYVMAAGSYGVQLFFLASAITLSYSMSARREGTAEYRNFYVRRFFRIAPMFWLAIVFYWIFPNLMPVDWINYWAPQGEHGSYFILTALFLHGWHPYTFNSIVPGGWSIAVEMTFYVFFPFCFHHITTLRRAILWLVGGIVLALAQEALFLHLRSRLWPDVPDGNVLKFFLHLWFPSQFVIFLVGIAAYFLLGKTAVQNVYRSRSWSSGLFCFSTLLLMALLYHSDGGVLRSVLVAIAMAGMIISMAGNAVPWLVNRFICHLGRLSYSCYLTHFAAIRIVVWLLHAFGHVELKGQYERVDTGHGAENMGFFFLIMLMGLALTFLFSSATKVLVEDPGIALGKKLIRKWGRGGSGTVSKATTAA